jgi:hypothetical protein
MIDENSYAKSNPHLNPRPNPRRRIFLWTLAGLTVVAGLYTGGWFFLSAELRGGIDSWIAQQKKSGLDIRYASHQRGGFPFAIKMIFDQPVIASDRKLTSFVWQGQQAIITVKPWNIRDGHIDLSGPQKIGIVRNGKTSTWQGHAGLFTADINFKSRTQIQLALNFGQVDMKSKDDKAQSEPQRVQLHRGRIVVLQNSKNNTTEKTPSLVFAADLTQLHVPKSVPIILGHQFKKIAVKSSVFGSLPRTIHLLPLTAWRDAGGTIEIDHFEVDHGPLNLKTKGTVALDENMQPMGAFSSQIYGFSEVISVLQNRNLIKSNVALTAHLVLGVMATRQGADKRPRLDVALSVQNQKLFIGPLAITKLPPIKWDRQLTAP